MEESWKAPFPIAGLRIRSLWHPMVCQQPLPTLSSRPHLLALRPTAVYPQSHTQDARAHTLATPLCSEQTPRTKGRGLWQAPAEWIQQHGATGS